MPQGKVQLVAIVANRAVVVDVRANEGPRPIPREHLAKHRDDRVDLAHVVARRRAIRKRVLKVPTGLRHMPDHKLATNSFGVYNSAR